MKHIQLFHCAASVYVALWCWFGDRRGKTFTEFYRETVYCNETYICVLWVSLCFQFQPHIYHTFDSYVVLSVFFHICLTARLETPVAAIIYHQASLLDYHCHHVNFWTCSSSTLMLLTTGFSQNLLLCNCWWDVNKSLLLFLCWHVLFCHPGMSVCSCRWTMSMAVMLSSMRESSRLWRHVRGDNTTGPIAPLQGGKKWVGLMCSASVREAVFFSKTERVQLSGTTSHANALLVPINNSPVSQWGWPNMTLNEFISLQQQ